MSKDRACLLLILLLGACKPPPSGLHFMPGADAERGRAAMERVGCAACHTVPGIAWPRGTLGPTLTGFARQGLIGGRLPNRPENLAAFVRDAPAVLPGATMPAMPLSEEEARDVAAYLYTLDDR